MTRGATPRFADTPYARWIEQELKRRGWNKKRLAAEMAAISEKPLKESGAYGIVHRATKGSYPGPENRSLIEQVLGTPPNVEERVSKLEDELQTVQAGLGDVRDMKESLERIEALLLERRDPSQDGEEAA